MGARHDQNDDLVLRKPHLFAYGGGVEFFPKPASHRNPCDLHARFRNLARTKRLGHRLRGDAEHIGVFVGP